MSFLDNLENNLKALENREEKDGREAQRRAAERDSALALAPWANRLRESAYVQKLLGLAARAGIQRRTKIFPAWLDNNLRLELKGQRLEVRPTPDGIVAFFIENQEEVRQQAVNLEADPGELLTQWLETVPVS